jgi:phosphoribosylamine---glycine ligase
MKILVIGGGGREHALAWKLAQSPGVEVFATPGNPGIAQVATCLSGPPLEAAIAVGAELTVVGPEGPLVAGLVDKFRASGLKIIGPSCITAQLEGSKVFAKDFMTKMKIPTAAFVAAENPAQAKCLLDRFGYPVVLKADALAGGKGVVIAQDRSQADAALAAFDGPLVIEEFLEGEEVSFIALCDGKTALPLAPTQDHKAVFDGDRGPNTGGMGAYCDSDILSAAQTEDILSRIITPTVEATSFTGFLYAGLMMTSAGPKVLEFNVRLGDPETQPLMHRMATDFASVLTATANAELSSVKLEWRPGPSVCVVLASAGYPGAYAVGIPIDGIPEAEAIGATVFHAGTRHRPTGFETAGGRVLGVTAAGDDLPSAINRAYTAARAIHFEGMHFRTDIGWRGLRRCRESAHGHPSS